MTNLKDYLNDTLLPDEEKQVVDLLAEDKLTAELDKELEEYFNSMTDNDPAVAQTAYFKAKRALGLKRSSVSRRAVSWIMGVAASMILFVIGLWTFNQYQDNIEPNWIEKRVANGDIVSLTLPDGSQLYMNSGTRVTYPDRFTGKTRQIFIDGEVYADIAKDPKRPFVINSGDVSVDVLGTKFNMKAYSDAECVEVILVEGSVRFNVLQESVENEVIMRPGNMLQYQRSTGVISLDQFPKDKFSAFYENRSMHFFNIMLEDIVTDLERLFCTKIIILNESIAKTKYFAFFCNNESLEEILDALNSDKKIKITKKNGVIYLK